MSSGEGFPDFEDLLDTFDGKDQFCSGSVTSLPPEVLSSSNASIKPSYENGFESKKKQDIWALGVVLYAMITGRLPFNDDFLPRLQHSIVFGDYKPLPEDTPRYIKTIISNFLSKNPKDRPSIKQITESAWFCE